MDPRSSRDTGGGRAVGIVPSPLGRLGLVAADTGLVELRFLGAEETSPPLEAGGPESAAILRQTERQLADYFSRRARVFDVPLAPVGSEFQKAVWRALGAVPYGVTISYRELARRVGKAGAVRAVGAANGANPVAIIIPCHRVIGADGSLVGYGGGLERKRKLLALEGVYPRDLAGWVI